MPSINKSLNRKRCNRSKKQKNFIVIIIFCLLGVVGYFIYDSFFGKENGENLKDKNQEIQEENLNTVAEKLVTVIEDSNVWRMIAIKQDVKRLDFNRDFIDNDILTAAIYAVGNCLNNRSCSSLPASTLDNYFKTNFGISNIDYKTIICPIDKKPIYKYNNLTQEYIFTGDHPHDGLAKGSQPIYIKINNIENDKNNYILTTTEIYNNMRDNEFISADQTGKVKIADYSDYINDEGNININKLITDYENDFGNQSFNYPKYKYTFKKVRGEYYLTKYEIIS